MHLSLDGFAAGPNGEMNRIKVEEEIFDHTRVLHSKNSVLSQPGKKVTFLYRLAPSWVNGVLFQSFFS